MIVIITFVQHFKNSKQYLPIQYSIQLLYYYQLFFNVQPIYKNAYFFVFSLHNKLTFIIFFVIITSLITINHSMFTNLR